MGRLEFAGLAVSALALFSISPAPAADWCEANCVTLCKTIYGYPPDAATCTLKTFA